MACRKRAALGTCIADSDPKSQPDHPTASEGLLEYSAEGLEQLRQAATEIMEGTAAAEQSVQEKEEELADDRDNKNKEALSLISGNCNVFFKLPEKSLEIVERHCHLAPKVCSSMSPRHSRSVSSGNNDFFSTEITRHN